MERRGFAELLPSTAQFRGMDEMLENGYGHAGPKPPKAAGVPAALYPIDCRPVDRAFASGDRVECNQGLARMASRANFQGRAGMVPVPGFERVADAELAEAGAYGYADLAGGLRPRVRGTDGSSAIAMMPMWERGGFSADAGRNCDRVNAEGGRGLQGAWSVEDGENLYASNEGSWSYDSCLAELEHLSLCSDHHLDQAVAKEVLSSENRVDHQATKVKLMCSFGGKIFPRLSDGKLRYVGGETRIIAVSKSIGYGELMRKLTDAYGEALLLKYQLPDEDLDALISVSSDEDFMNMMEEYDRLGGGGGSSRLRVFLFSAADHDFAHFEAMDDSRNPQQQYLDAINGIPETGFRRLADSVQSAPLQQSQKWNGSARVQNIPNSLPSVQVPKGTANAVHLLVNMPLPSNEAIKGTSVALASSSPPLSSLPTHTKQFGVADIPVSFIPEQHLKVGQQSYSILQLPEGHLQDLGGSAVSQCSLRCRLPESRTVNSPTKVPTIFSPPASHSDLIYHADPQVDDPILPRIESHGKLSNLQEGIEVALPTLDRGVDVRLFPMDHQHIASQQPQSPLHQPLWQHQLDAQQDGYVRGDYSQQARFDGGHMQQSFSQHSPLSVHLNGDHLPTNEAMTCQPVDRVLPNQDDAFEGPPLQKVVSIHQLGHVVPAVAALQLVGSDPPSPRVGGRQVSGVQQNIQVQRPSNAPHRQQHGTIIHAYNDQPSRAICPSTSPMGYCELMAEQFVHPHTLPSVYEGQFGRQQAMPNAQVSYSNEHAIPQKALSPVYSDTFMQDGMKLVHSIYEGTASSEAHHSDGSVRPALLYAGPSVLQEEFMSPQDSPELEAEREVGGPQGKERLPNLSGQQRYMVMPGGSEHLPQQIPKMLISSQAGPGGTYVGMGVSEDFNPFLGPRLDESYQTYKKMEIFEPFGGASFQLKQSAVTEPHGEMDILAEALQAPKLTQQMKDAQLPSSVPSIHEVRTAHPLTENVNSYSGAIIHSEPPTICQMPVERQGGDVLIQVSPGGVESFMQQTWQGDCLDTDLAKGEASMYAFGQRENIGEDESKEASTLCKMLRPVDSHDTNALGENVNNIPSLSQNHSMGHVGKSLVDNDNTHSANMRQDTSFNKLKKTSPNTEAVALPHRTSDFDMSRVLSPDKSASTTLPSCKYDDPSVCMQRPAADYAALSINNLVSQGILIKGEGPACAHVTMQDNSDEYIKGELQNLAEGVAEAVLRPTLPSDPTLPVPEWVQVGEDVNVEERMQQVNEGAEEETAPIEDSAFEEVKNEDSDNDDHVSDAVIAEAEAIRRGLQTIKNADLEELRELGSGTFGTVYYGKWRGSDVAIKRIKNSCFSGRPSHQDRLRADFWSEACMLAQLHHPNVVAFYGVVPDGPGGTLGTVTEYMVNGSLKQVLQRKDRTIDRSKRLLIAMDAAFGMEYLHSKNIVHFDLKCENLLVNMRDPQRPICKVADFGLSKIKHQTLVSGGVRGTLPWMAPELLNGSSSMVSEKVDVYSFGIVMWELLTGEEPYANMHYGAIIGGIVSNTLRPPVPHWCDPAWRSLMEWCWSADPVARPSFTKIANELRAMQASLHSRGQVHQAPIQANEQKQS